MAAKLKAAALSSAAAWLIVVVAIPLALRTSGTAWIVVDDARRLAEIFGTPRAIAIGLLALIALLASTWKQLVHSLYVGVSGRPWLVKGSVFATLTVLTLMVVVAPWVLERRWVIARLIHLLPWVLALLVGSKLVGACWVAVRLHDSRLISGRTLVLAAVGWDLAVLTLFGVFSVAAAERADE